MEIRRTAGGVVVGRSGKIVVVNQNGNSWSLPKGGVDNGETLRQAAEREIKEESGINELEYVSDIGTYRRQRIPLSEGTENPREIKEITLFLYKTDQEKLEPEDPDNPEAIWVEVDEVVNILTHQKDKQFFESKIPLIKQKLGL